VLPGGHTESKHTVVSRTLLSICGVFFLFFFFPCIAWISPTVLKQAESGSPAGKEHRFEIEIFAQQGKNKCISIKKIQKLF